MSFIRKIKRGEKVYLAEVENVWIDGKCRQKHIRYVGKEVDNKTILTSSISNIEVDSVKVYGPLLILHHIANEIKLPEILGKFAPEILSLVYSHCLDYRSINYMTDWFKRTDLNILLSLDAVTEDKLLKSLDYLEKSDSPKWQKQVFNNIKSHYKIEDSGLVYDVTNTYLYGKHCPLAKEGHDKENVKGRPLIQIALAVTKKEGIPVFHKTYHGNIHDARTLSDIMIGFQEHGIKSKCIIFDRGITSKNSIKYLKNNHWEVICGVPVKGDLKKKIRTIISKNNFIQYDNRVSMGDNIFYVQIISYTIGEVTGILAICFNDKQRNLLRESRYDEIYHAGEQIKKHHPVKPGIKKFFDKSGNINKEILSAAEEFDGYSCIFSTEKMLKEIILKIYFGEKDIIEKAFRSLKGVVKLRPIRHWLYNRVAAHVYICYLSYLLLSLLKFRLQKLAISPIQALMELETMYKVYMKETEKNISFTRTVMLTKKQEVILKIIDKKLLKNPSV